MAIPAHRARPRPPRITTRTTDEPTTPRDRDGGFSLVELILVVAILGVLGSVAWLGVTGMTTEAADTGCLADRRQLHVATESFFAQRGVDVVPATGTDTDRHERTLVDQGFLARVSSLHHLAADGTVSQEDPSC